jgi:hypothetical protein
MQRSHIGIDEFAGSPVLFAQSSGPIWTIEATMSVLSFLRTSLLDLAERKLGLFLAQQAAAASGKKLTIRR